MGNKENGVKESTVTKISFKSIAQRNSVVPTLYRSSFKNEKFIERALSIKQTKRAVSFVLQQLWTSNKHFAT